MEHLFASLLCWRVVHDIWLGPMSIFAAGAMCRSFASPKGGGFADGHGNLELLLGVVFAMCACCAQTPPVTEC